MHDIGYEEAPRLARCGYLPYEELMRWRSVAADRRDIAGELELLRLTEEDPNSLSYRVLAIGKDCELQVALDFLLSRAPSDDVWHALFRLVERDPTLLSRFEDVLDNSWPDRMRPMPRSWWQRMLDGDDATYFRLARANSFFDDDIDLADLKLAVPKFQHLRALQLTRTRLGDEGMEVLVESPSIASLKELWLDANEIGPAGAAAIAGSPYLGGIEVLELSNNELTDQALVALAGSLTLGRLRELRLAGNSFEETGAAAILAENRLAALSHLDLSQNHIDTKKLIGAWEHLIVRRKPVDLALRGNQQHTTNWMAFFASPHLTCLSGMDLTWCNLTADDAVHLARSPYQGHSKIPPGHDGDGFGTVLAEVLAGLWHGETARADQP